jgi:hypothetical protein
VKAEKRLEAKAGAIAMARVEKTMLCGRYPGMPTIFSMADYERLKKSIAEEGWLLVPIILNQDNVVLDGHHRLKACKELGFPITYYVKNFTGKPPEELRYVVSFNLHRAHLDEN